MCCLVKFNQDIRKLAESKLKEIENNINEIDKDN